MPPGRYARGRHRAHHGHGGRREGALKTWAIAAAWAAAVGCWLLLFRASRRRAALLRVLSLEYAGFMRSGFHWATFMVEPLELVFTRLVAGIPVRFRLRYVLPLTGGGLPRTEIGFRLAGDLLGSAEGRYAVEDFKAGRGLFLGGANLTAQFARFAGTTPHAPHFSLSWTDGEILLSVPGLLGIGEVLWMRHCVEFMAALAAAVAGAGREPPRLPVPPLRMPPRRGGNLSVKPGRGAGVRVRGRGGKRGN